MLWTCKDLFIVLSFDGILPKSDASVSQWKYKNICCHIPEALFSCVHILFLGPHPNNRNFVSPLHVITILLYSLPSLYKGRTLAPLFSLKFLFSLIECEIQSWILLWNSPCWKKSVNSSTCSTISKTPETIEASAKGDVKFGLHHWDHADWIYGIAPSLFGDKWSFSLSVQPYRKRQRTMELSFRKLFEVF